MLSGAIATATFNTERMEQALDDGFVDATEIADWLATKGVPFREAHHVTGELVSYALEQGTSLGQLSLAELQKHHDAFDESVFAVLDMEAAVDRRASTGGPARQRVQAALLELQSRLGSRKKG